MRRFAELVNYSFYCAAFATPAQHYVNSLISQLFSPSCSTRTRTIAKPEAGAQVFFYVTKIAIPRPLKLAHAGHNTHQYDDSLRHTLRENFREYFDTPAVCNLDNCSINSLRRRQSGIGQLRRQHPSY